STDCRFKFVPKCTEGIVTVIDLPIHLHELAFGGGSVPDLDQIPRINLGDHFPCNTRLLERRGSPGEDILLPERSATLHKDLPEPLVKWHAIDEEFVAHQDRNIGAIILKN